MTREEFRALIEALQEIAKEQKKGETENIRDTMMFLFNENLEFVPRY